MKNLCEGKRSNEKKKKKKNQSALIEVGTDNDVRTDVSSSIF